MTFFHRLGGEHLVAAHRGARAVRPENTLCAFEHALGRCDFLEVDVQCSRDGVPVILHDATLSRTSDVARVPAFSDRAPWRVHDFSLDELRRLDFGSWFLEADPFHALQDGELDPGELEPLLPQPLPTLAELLQFVHDQRFPVNLEIKDLSGTPCHRRVVGQMVEQIRCAGCSERVLISSMHHHYLRQLAEQAPDISTAALVADRHPPALVAYLRDLGVCAYHPADAITDASLVELLARAGIAVNVFTVNDPVRKTALFAMGVRSVFTDCL